MDKLEEVAREYAKGYYSDNIYPSEIKDIVNNLELSFTAGVEWQKNNMWISVEEFGYPPFDKKCEIDKRERYLLRVVSGSISQTVSYEIGHLAREHRFVGEMDWVSVTHWMPIPEIKKGE